jgi:hypothetical protein
VTIGVTANNDGTGSMQVGGTTYLSINTSGQAAFSITGYGPNQNLTDAATVAWNTLAGQVATFTFVSSNRTMGAPTGLVNGAFYALAVIQNAGSNTLSWNSVFKWAVALRLHCLQRLVLRTTSYLEATALTFINRVNH